MTLSLGSRKRDIFFQVQTWDPKLLSWVKEAKIIFRTLEEAKSYINSGNFVQPVRILKKSGKKTEIIKIPKPK
jgi:hypothetical protein